MPTRKTIALIPLRGGSKSIPLKNIKLMNGKPLCYYALLAATQAGSVDEVYISTDSDRIANEVDSLGLGARILKRPAKYATDNASTESVMLHFAQEVPFDYLVTLQATSPLTTAKDVDAALAQMIENANDSLLTAVRTKRFYWSSDGLPLNYNPAKRPRRQDFDGAFVENGAFYITTRQVLEEHKCRLGGSVGIYEMPEETLVEIDEPEDWRKVEMLLSSNRLLHSEALKRVKALVCDVDGTLTDGGMYYTADGEALKKFNTRDAMGLSLLQKAGVSVVVLTRESSPSVHARMEKLGISEYYHGVQNKVEFLEQFGAKKGIAWEEIAYVGDDVNDLESMQRVGFAACPADAVDEIADICDYCSAHPGGKGAVRDVCDLIRKAN